MSFQVSIHEQVIWTRFSGHLTLDDLTAAAQVPVSRAELLDLRCRISDFSAVMSHEVAETDLIAPAALVLGTRAMYPHLRMAAVWRGPDILALLLSYMELSGVPLTLLASEDEARAWVAANYRRT